MPKKDVVMVGRKKNKRVKLNKRLFLSLFWQKGAGQATNVTSSYTRPTGGTVSTAVVPFFLLQVYKSRRKKNIVKMSLVVPNVHSVSLNIRKLYLTHSDWIFLYLITCSWT